MNDHHARTCAALLLLIGALATQTAAAASDVKSISPMDCLPRGPGTTVNELTYGPYGITNPGTTTESVICPINGDSESHWSSTPGVGAYLEVYYRTGSEAGNLSYSAFVGTAATTPLPTYTVSHTSATQPANTRDQFTLDLADVSGYYGIAPAASLVCTLAPKVGLGWIYLREYLATDVP